MTNKIVVFFSLVFMLFSCKNDDQKRNAENKKDIKKREILFKNIEKAWVFYDEPVTEMAEKSLINWSQWRLFLDALAQKPKKTIGAFQQKTKELTKKAMALNEGIPLEFDIPPVKSRISALITKIQMLDLYLNLATVSDKKVIAIIAEINLELVSLQRQMQKTIDKSKIPIEEGETDLLKMRNASRAIPNIIIDPNTPKVE